MNAYLAGEGASHCCGVRGGGGAIPDVPAPAVGTFGKALPGCGRPPAPLRLKQPSRPEPPPDRPSHATASRRPRLGRRHVGLAQGDGQLQVLLLLPPQPRQPLLLRLLALPLGPCQLLFLIAKLQRGKTERGLRGPRCGGGDLGLCGMRWGEDCIARQGSGDGRDAAAVSVYGKGVGG